MTKIPTSSLSSSSSSLTSLKKFNHHHHGQEKTSTTTKNIDEILNYLGNIGWYQMKTYFLSLLPVFISGMLSTSFIFTTSIPEHRCFIPNCDDDLDQSYSINDLFDKSFLKFSTPLSNDMKKFDSCRMFQVNYDHYNNNNNNNCNETKFNRQISNYCDKFIFNKEYFHSTIATEFSLFCQNSWIVQLLQTTFFFGVLLGSILNGIMADKYGRRLIFRIYSPITFSAILLDTFASNILVYGIGLFFKGVCVAGLYQSAFTVGIECLGGKWRFWLGNMYSIHFAIGAIYSCFIAYITRTWDKIEALSLVPAAFLLPYPFILSESIRWQFSSGKIEEALIQVQLAAKMNDIKIPNNIMEPFFVINQNSNDEKNDGEQNAIQKRDVSIKDLFWHKLIRKWTITFLFIWFTNALVYYGLAFLASEINSDIYLSMVLLMIIEVPGTLLASYAGQYTRKYVLMFCMIFGGLACFICSLVPNGQIKMWMGMLGKMGISGSFALIYIYAAEIFPTVLRITGLGMCSFCARIGAMIAPYLLSLNLFGDFFPFLVIAIITTIAGLVCFILPETQGKKLPDSLEEVEQLKHSTRKSQGYGLVVDKEAVKTTKTTSVY